MKCFKGGIDVCSQLVVAGHGQQLGDRSQVTPKPLIFGVRVRSEAPEGSDEEYVEDLEEGGARRERLGGREAGGGGVGGEGGKAGEGGPKAGTGTTAEGEEHCVVREAGRYNCSEARRGSLNQFREDDGATEL